jgi:hypothetical protein
MMQKRENDAQSWKREEECIDWLQTDPNGLPDYIEVRYVYVSNGS